MERVWLWWAEANTTASQLDLEAGRTNVQQVNMRAWSVLLNTIVNDVDTKSIKGTALLWRDINQIYDAQSWTKEKLILSFRIRYAWKKKRADRCADENLQTRFRYGA
jgi:hypothetical protein